VAAEELREDVEFEAVDELYSPRRLRRTRHVWLAYRGNKEEPVGAASLIAVPGLEFQLSRNRCDLLLHPSLPESDALGVVASLLKHLPWHIGTLSLMPIPVIADQISVPALLKLGVEFCSPPIAKESGLEKSPPFLSHVDRFYSKLLVRAEKHACSHRCQCRYDYDKKLFEKLPHGRSSGVGRPYRLEHPQSVHETWRETSTIYVALIDSGRAPKPQTTFHCSTRTRLPPSTVLVRPASLGKLCIDVCEIEERYKGKGPIRRMCAESFGGSFV